MSGEAVSKGVVEMIRAIRGRAGVTQREAARRMGVRQATISRWESGVHRLTQEQAAKLVQVILHRPRQEPPGPSGPEEAA